MTTFWQDLRYGLRMLVKSKGTTAVVVVTLALGIAANAVIFSIVNGFLRPLPVKDPQQLVVLATRQKGAPVFANRVSYPDLEDFRKEARSFSDVFACAVDLLGMSADGKAEQFVAAYVTGNYFSGLGVKPAAGRLFLPSEGQPGGESSYVVIGYDYWHKRFAGDPAIVGKQVKVNGEGATIIGVSPKGFYGVYSILNTDGYLLLSRMSRARDNSMDLFADRAARHLKVVARLKPGVSVRQAQNEMNVIAEGLAEQYAATDKGVAVEVIPERLARPEPLPGNMVPVIAGLFLFLAGLLLLLACMNVANILLVRATVRQREMGIRAAMGAGRGRLIRQVLTETSLIALLGGLAGFFLAIWASPGLVESTKLGGGVPIRMDFRYDGHVFVYGLGAVILTAILMSVWPAWRAARADLNTILREGGEGGKGGSERHRVRDILVVAQVAGSLTLLIAAGLFARSLSKAQRMYLGFDPDHLLNVTVNPEEIGYGEARAKDFFRELESRARALPGVQSASMALSVPMSGTTNASNIYIEGHPTPAGQQPPIIFFNNVDAAYFQTTRVPILRGRAFTDSDDENARSVAVVNQTMAAQYWPNEDPIGKRFSLKSAAGPFVEVVGLAADGKYIFVAESPQPYFYVPLAQNFAAMRTLQIRTSIPPENLTDSMRELVHSLAPDLPIFHIGTMQDTLEGGNGFMVFREGAARAAEMGGLGLLLAVVGVFGVVSYAAAQRTHEIGIRMALGAGPRDILRLVLGQGVRLIGAGVLLGLGAAWALTRAMSRMLIGVSSTDPLTYAGASLILGAVALWACYLPARRAARVEPLAALRYE